MVEENIKSEQSKKLPLLILTGPTAVGKTSLSISLARELNGEIISADSMQVYRYMDIGTAKINQKEMGGIPHYLIDEILPDEEFNVVCFQKRAKQYIKQIYDRGKLPILVGGTGFYIQSVLYDIDFTEQEESSIRKELTQLLQKNGPEFLHEMLKQVDPISYTTIHMNNHKRVIRAIEYYRQTGVPISQHNEEQRRKESPYHYFYFVLNQERSVLYQRINQRVDQMIAQGLVLEVKHLREMGYDRTLTSMQGLGYKEIYAYLEGEYSLEEAVSMIKQETRHFAKRQLTWFRREKETILLSKEKYHNESEILAEITKRWNEG